MFKNILKKVYNYLFKSIKYKIVHQCRYIDGHYVTSYRLLIYKECWEPPYKEWKDLAKINGKLFPNMYYSNIEECEKTLRIYIEHLRKCESVVIKKGLKTYA
jgi:hypothetical protein